MEEQPSAVKPDDDSMATDNFHSAIDDSKFIPVQEEVKQASAAKVDKVASVEDDWIKLRTQNQILNPDTQKHMSAFDSQQIPLPLNPDGTLSFFWIDAHEE